MKFIILKIFLLSISAEVLAGPQIAWESQSRPEIMQKDFERTFSKLPLKGQVREIKNYWSSDYWPLFKGSINYRWNAPVPQGFNLKSPPLNEALRMSLEEMKTLSPAEKLDLLNGQYTYPLKKAVAKIASPRRREWEGMCHGWAAAALNHKEPVPKTITNKDGLMIPFGSSDIKALVSYYYAYIEDPVSTHQMGRRCNGKKYCDQDLNAGAFHIILANKVGREGKGFIVDIEHGREVWNQVAYRFETKILGRFPPERDAARGTMDVVRVQTTLRVVFNIVKNSWGPVLGTNLQTFKDLVFEYDLDVNSEDKIIGGKWRSKERADFLWTMAKVKKFGGLFQQLPRLLQDK